MATTSPIYTLRYTAEAVAGLYLIPRGPAAEVTAAIRALQRTPTPYVASPEPTGRPHTYTLIVADHTLTYQVNEESRVITILLIES
jgi:hypothetical protein